MNRFIKHLGIPVCIILVMPLLGLVFNQKPWQPFLAFPPKTSMVSRAPFSLIIFIFIALFIATATLPLIKKGMAYQSRKKPSFTSPFPWWGFSSLFSLIFFWVLAWTRFEWFSMFQAHTFFPLWFSLIVFINSLVYRATGQCPLVNSGYKFYLLFAVSAVFWWVFEYLNRFVSNWYYTGSQYSALKYFFLASISFSTVLPAVESMKALVLTFDCFTYGFKTCRPMGWIDAKPFSFAIIIASVLSLFFVGLFPDQLFFTIWISPFLLILGCHILSGQTHVCSSLKTGDFTRVAAYASAALVCGFFWELFNLYSLSRWQYSIPYVQALHLFEMPLLGYAGYLPFGLECALVIDLIFDD